MPASAPPFEGVLITEDVEYGTDALPRRLGTLFTVDAYRDRFADLLTRGWDWINLHAVGMLGSKLILSIEMPATPAGSARWTWVNMSGPCRAVADRGFDLRSFVAD